MINKEFVEFLRKQNLPVAKLARMADIDRLTADSALKGESVNTNTLDKLLKPFGKQVKLEVVDLDEAA